MRVCVCVCVCVRVCYQFAVIDEIAGKLQCSVTVCDYCIVLVVSVECFVGLLVMTLYAHNIYTGSGRSENCYSVACSYISLMQVHNTTNFKHFALNYVKK